MSDYNQQSFIGGMNLILDATRLTDKEYRIGLNVRNRYDALQTIKQSKKDVAAPIGVKQEMITFGNYVVVFVSGAAYYRAFDVTGWQPIPSFKMSSTAPRLWTESVPVGLTNYGRIGVPLGTAAASPTNANLAINTLAGLSAGNIPGLLVQDNISQPVFIYIDPSTGLPVARTTQSYDEWSVTYDGTTADTITKMLSDNREYVPVGSSMCWTDGILYITSQDGESIYRSVSGRPLDFVVNVDPAGKKGGDATTTSYSVGVGGISCLRPTSDGGLIVSASNANFLVSKNTTPGAPTEFGEYTFIRRFLFNATNLSNRTIIDTLGDTRFIDLTGIRSFNAVLQLENEGRNSVFSAKIQPIMDGIVQDFAYSAAILYNNYEFYAIQSIIGPVIAVYDTLTQSWSSFDTSQTGGFRIKQFAKIESTVQRLYAIAEDDNLYELYAGTENAVSIVRTGSVNHTDVGSQGTYKVNDPKYEVKLSNVRIILDTITSDCTLGIEPFVNNRLSEQAIATKNIKYVAPVPEYAGHLQLNDTNTMLYNALFNTPNCNQGWSVYVVITWTGGQLSQYSLRMIDISPMNPLNSQKNP